VDESRQTSVAGVYACGNVVHVHDLVDFVVEESEIAGKGAAGFLEGHGEAKGAPIELVPGDGLKYVVPQRMRGINGQGSLDLYLRVNRVYGRSAIEVRHGGEALKRAKRLRMNPGELERVRLQSSVLEALNGSNLTVEAVEIGG
jgi:hypothetical protein